MKRDLGVVKNHSRDFGSATSEQRKARSAAVSGVRSGWHFSSKNARACSVGEPMEPLKSGVSAALARNSVPRIF